MIRSLGTIFCLVMTFSVPSKACEIYDGNGALLATVEQANEDSAFGFQARVGQQTLIHNIDWKVLFYVKDSEGEYLGSAVDGVAYFDKTQVAGLSQPRFVGSAQVRDNEIFLHEYMDKNLLGYIRIGQSALHKSNNSSSEVIGNAVSCKYKEAASGLFFLLND